MSKTSRSLPFATAGDAIPLTLVGKNGLNGTVEGLTPAQLKFITAQGFTAAPGQVAAVPGADGVERYLIAIADEDPDAWRWAIAGLSETLPEGVYRLADAFDPARATQLALGWALGSYQFLRYKPAKRASCRLLWPEAADRQRVEIEAQAIFDGRDWINTPAADMGPGALAEVAQTLAVRHNASCTVIIGDDLLHHNYPAIHAVGRAAADAPRLIDIIWGEPTHPKLTLVGKGVCFDSGGLDIKSAAGMQLMKKDMGGAAIVLAVADIIMALGLKLRLRVLVPAVENAIAGNAFRPLDVLATRVGKTVEVGNTDAEGRLILADALAEAASDNPALLIDCATLTGAARVALGTDVPVYFTRHNMLAFFLENGSREVGELIWRLPLVPDYRPLLDSRTADISSTGDSAYAGAILAALLLAEFVLPEIPWLHFDMMAWNVKSRPGRPEGGEVQAARTLLSLAEKLARNPDIMSAVNQT